MKRKNIVILGAGFAGLRVAKLLSKKLSKNSAYRIVLVDKKSFHLYTPDLYEVATAFSEKIGAKCLLRLKETVAVPLRNLIDLNLVELVFDRVLDIDSKNKKVKLLKGKNLSYDYLVVALGSETNFFGIKGMQEHCYPLKTVKQALTINSRLDQYFYDLWNKREHRKPIHINVCGGGATGVETAAELCLACNKLCEKYQYERSSVNVQLIEGGADLAHFGEKGTVKLKHRLEKLGVKLLLNSYVTKAAEKSLTLKMAEEKTLVVASDITIWTAGVKVNSPIAVNKYLQSKDSPEIFALGDNALIQDDEGKPVPWLAQMAVKEANVASRNIIAMIDGGRMKAFKSPKNIPIIIPVGGKYAFLNVGGLTIGGYLFHLLRKFVDFRYYLSIMSFLRAFRKWRRGEKIFEAND